MYEKRTHINIGAYLTIPAGTAVSVYADSDCTTLATIYADDGVTEAVNPVIVDGMGGFSYRAPNGVYYEKIGAGFAVELRFDDGSGTGGDIIVTTLPEASIDYQGQRRLISGDGESDQWMICLKNEFGEYNWLPVALGGF